MYELTQRWRSALALILLLVVITLFYQVIVRPLWGISRENSARIGLLHEQIGRSRGMSASLPLLEQKLAALMQNSDLGNFILEGESGTLAAAELQNRIRLVTESYDADLISTRIHPFLKEGAFQRVTVNVSLRVTSDVLQKILYDLESGLPFVIIDNVLIQAPQPELRNNQANGGGLLIVQLDLSGFAKPASMDL